MNRILPLMLAIIAVIAGSCKTREKKGSSSETLVSDDLRLSFKPRKPRVGDEFTVQIEILRDGELVSDGAGSKVTVQLSYRCGTNKNYSRAQLAEADDGIAEIELTIGTRRGQTTSCSFRVVAGDVTKEKFSVKLAAGDNYRDDHRPNDRQHDNRHHHNRHHHNNRQPQHRCGQDNRRQRQNNVSISKPVVANNRGPIPVAKEFTVTNESHEEVDIELRGCGRVRLFRYQPRRVLEEADCHIVSPGETKMFIIGTVDKDCDFVINGREINFERFSSVTLGRPECPPASLLEYHDSAFQLDDRQWQIIRQDQISRQGFSWDDYRNDLLIRIGGWWCLLD